MLAARAWAVASAEPGESGRCGARRAGCVNTTLTAVAESVKPAEVQRACHLMHRPTVLPGHGPLPLLSPAKAAAAEPAEPAAGDNGGRCGILISHGVVTVNPTR